MIARDMGKTTASRARHHRLVPRRGGGGVQRLVMSQALRGKCWTDPGERSRVFGHASKVFRDIKQTRGALYTGLQKVGKSGTMSHRSGGSAFGHSRKRKGAELGAYAATMARAIAGLPNGQEALHSLNTAVQQSALQELQHSHREAARKKAEDRLHKLNAVREWSARHSHDVTREALPFATDREVGSTSLPVGFDMDFAMWVPPAKRLALRALAQLRGVPQKREPTELPATIRAAWQERHKIVRKTKCASLGNVAYPPVSIGTMRASQFSKPLLWGMSGIHQELVPNLCPFWLCSFPFLRRSL